MLAQVLTSYVAGFWLVSGTRVCVEAAVAMADEAILAVEAAVVADEVDVEPWVLLWRIQQNENEAIEAIEKAIEKQRSMEEEKTAQKMQIEKLHCNFYAASRGQSKVCYWTTMDSPAYSFDQTPCFYADSRSEAMATRGGTRVPVRAQAADRAAPRDRFTLCTPCLGCLRASQASILFRACGHAGAHRRSLLDDAVDEGDDAA